MTKDSHSPVYQQQDIHRILGDHQHQIGNSFQTLLSFMRLRMRMSKTLTHKDMDAILLYLTLLSTLHANLGEKVLSGLLSGSLPFETVLNQLIDEWSSRMPQVEVSRSIDSCSLAPKKVMGIGAIIVAMLSSNMVKSSNSIEFTLSVPEDTPNVFKVKCTLGYESTIDSAAMQEDPNFMLASTLCKASSSEGLTAEFLSPTKAIWKFDSSI